MGLDDFLTNLAMTGSSANAPNPSLEAPQVGSGGKVIRMPQKQNTVQQVAPLLENLATNYVLNQKRQKKQQLLTEIETIMSSNTEKDPEQRYNAFNELMLKDPEVWGEVMDNSTTKQIFSKLQKDIDAQGSKFEPKSREEQLRFIEDKQIVKSRILSTGEEEKLAAQVEAIKAKLEETTGNFKWKKPKVQGNERNRLEKLLKDRQGRLDRSRARRFTTEQERLISDNMNAYGKSRQETIEALERVGLL